MDWLAENRSVITTFSSFLLITSFLFAAARSGKTKRNAKRADDDAVLDLTNPESATGADQGTGHAATDIVALLPSPESEQPIQPSTRPSLIVLPLEGLGETNEEKRYRDEFHGEIVAVLSRSSDIAVIGKKAQEWSANKGLSIRALGQELNVRYAASGEFVKRGDTQRLSIHLLEFATGGSIWSKRFDLNRDTDIGELMNKITGNVASEILRVEAERMLGQEPGRLSAEDLTHRAGHRLTAFNRRTFHEVETLARLAIDLNASAPGGYGVLAGAMALKAHQSWTSSPEEDLDEAFSMGSRAVELSPGDPRMLFWWGHVHVFGGRTDDAIGILENAISRDPSYVPSHILLGAALILARQPEKGVARIVHALDLSPDHALAFRALLWLGMGQAELENYAAAQIAFQESIHRNVIKNPADSADAFWAWIGKAGANAMLGLRQDAEAIVSRLRERFVDHDYSIMFDHAEASFAPGLWRLRVIVTVDTILISPANDDPPPPKERPSFRNLFRRRASVEGPIS